MTLSVQRSKRSTKPKGFGPCRRRVKGKKGARKRDHVVPLTRQALAVLEDVPAEGDFVFPGGKEGAGLSNAAMSELLKGMGYAPEYATVHGFRSTFKDWAADETDYPNEMSECDVPRGARQS